MEEQTSTSQGTRLPEAAEQAQEIAEVVFRSQGIRIGDDHIADFGRDLEIDWEKVFELGT